MGTQPNEVPLVRSVPDFGTFYRREYPAVATLTMVLTRSRQAAEDIAQDSFLKAHRDWDRVGNFDNPEGWVRRVATNLAMSRFRRLRAEMSSPVLFDGRNVWDPEWVRELGFRYYGIGRP